MFSISSSSSSSSSSSTTNSLINKLNKTKIVSCVLALSKIAGNTLSKNFTHAALLLIDSNSEIDDDSRGDGILVEYGDYSPKMSKEEIEAVSSGRVIYRYGDKGGLRYYGFKYSEYLQIFGDVCYSSMDIKSEKQITFKYFIDKIAPTNENKWIQENYEKSILKGIFSEPQNCQYFASEALKLLEPKFESRNIIVTDRERKPKNKIDILPNNIKRVLETLRE